MRALVFHGSHEVAVETVPDPVLRGPDDIILRVTSSAITGSDLHLYHGRVPELYGGDILGHEFMGEVVEAAPGVTALGKGARVVVPSVIACGGCFFCRRQQFAACETTNPERGMPSGRHAVRRGAALFGHGQLYGGVPGGQADYVRVPKANVGPMPVPDMLTDEQALFLADSLPTAYQAVLNTEIGEGDSLAIFGAGPVGMLSAACARMLGAGVIYMVGHHRYRLDFASTAYGTIPIDFDQVEAAQFILDQTDGRGVDGVIDAAGFEAKGSALETALTSLRLEGSSGAALRQCIEAVRRGGIISVPGMYAGLVHAFQFGEAHAKGVTFRIGPTHVQRYMPALLEALVAGRLQPHAIISHRLKLEQAVEGYRLFDKREENCRKVVLTP